MKRSGKRILGSFAASALALSFALTGCGSSSTNSAKLQGLPAVVVGYTSSLSAGTSDLGISALHGMEMALEEYNAGNPKYNVTIKSYDDQVKTDVATQNTTRLITEDHAVIVLGFANSGNINAANPLFEKYQVPVIDNVATGYPITLKDDKGPEPKPWTFRVTMHDGLQVPTFLGGAQKNGIKKVAILSDTTGYGKFGHDTIMRLKDQYGITVVAEQTFKLEDTDMTAQLQKAKDAGAEAICTYTLAPALAAILRSADKLGWYPPIYGSWTLGQPKLYQLAGPDLMKKFKIFIAQSFDPNANATNKKFAQDWAKKFPKDVPEFYGVAAAQGYDSMRIALKVLDQVGPDPKKLRDALETVSGYQGLTKATGFSATDHEAIHMDAMFLGTYDKDYRTIIRAQ